MKLQRYVLIFAILCSLAVLTQPIFGQCTNGQSCAVPNGAGTCVNGKCTLASCNRGFQDCDKNAANGCETNVSVDPRNCGGCGHVCTTANGTAGCGGGSCTVASCNPGFGDCNRNVADGCETNLNTDPKNCGACGKVCGTGQSCVKGACAAPAGDILCGGAYVDPKTDVNNCGKCANVCKVANGTGVCKSGVCAFGSCNKGFAVCGNVAVCTDLSTDPLNCGGCKQPCPKGKCELGRCK